MDSSFLIDLVKIMLPSLLVLLITYLMIRSYFDNQLALKKEEVEIKRNEMDIKRSELAMKNEGRSVPIRLQAYERLILLLERNQPFKLLTNIYDDDLTVPEYQLLLINTIRSELEHNLTQQLYVSDDAWSVVRSSLEELINTINILAKQQPNEATGRHLKKSIVDYFMQQGVVIPNHGAIQFLKAEARGLLA